MKEVSLRIETLLGNNQKLTFLVGAGCSVDAPSCQPAGRSMMDAMIKFSCAESEVDKISKIEELRFEALVEIIRDNLDPNLKIIDFYGQCDKPNIQHFYLAEMINKGHFIMTTNFDFLIEHALLQIGVKKEEIKVIITKNDFQQFNNPSELFSKGIKTVYKIHGSTKNMITDENTRDTLVATIQAFGSNKEGMSVFQVEPFKRPLFNNIVSGRSLVILGYSGSDDFDIVPTLKMLENIDNIIWINFTLDDGGKERIYEIDSNDINISNHKEKVNQILSEIKQMNNANHVYRIDVNSSRLIKQLLTSKPNLSSENFSIAPLNWIKENINAPNELMTYFIPQTLYFDFNMLDDSLRCAQNSLRISQQAKDEIMIIKALNLIGKINHEQGNYSEALKIYKGALELSEKVDPKEWKAACINNIGNVYNVWGKFSDALSYFEKAFPLFKQVGDLYSMAIVLRNIGTIYKNLGKNSEALARTTEALHIFDQLGKLSDKGDIHMIIGMIQTSLGNIDEAYSNYQESLKINDLLHDLNGKIVALNTIGELFRMVGKFHEAFDYLEEALTLSERIGDLIKKTSTLNNIGMLYISLTNFPEALKCLEEALRIGKQLKDPSNEASSYNNMGMIYFYQGNHSNALKVWEKALKLFDQTGNQPGKATLLINLGKLYREKGNLKRALKAFEDASQISIEINQPHLQAKCLEDIGMILEDQKNYEESLKMYENALVLFQQVGDPVGIAGIIHNIGTIDFFQGNIPIAIQKYEQALQILTQLGLNDSPLAQTIIKNIDHAKENL